MSDLQGYNSDTNFADSLQDLICQLLEDFTVIVCDKCS